jgi:hypothetical protein
MKEHLKSGEHTKKGRRNKGRKNIAMKEHLKSRRAYKEGTDQQGKKEHCNEGAFEE